MKKYYNKIKNSKNKLLITSILITILSTITTFTFCYICTPKIILTKDTINIIYNNKYKEPGYKSYILNKDLTNKVKIKNNIDNNKIGNYEVIYEVKFLFLTTRKKRIVKIIDNEYPEIILKGKNEVNICPQKEYKEEGYIATDNYDGIITDKVTINKKDNEIYYKVKDTYGNITTKTRKIIKEDKEKPKITLLGSNNMNIYTGNKYIEPGYTATDNCDGDLTKEVQISGTVNTNKTGSNIITYKVTDKSGNIETITRTINIINNNYYSSSGNGIIYLTFDDGPSATITPKVLDILKEENIKVTFFLVNRGDNLNYLIKREYNEGHTVALHSNTHNYSIDYASKDAYINGLNILSNKVNSLIGIHPKIIRFPGGSSNTVSARYTKGVMTYLAAELTKRGYKYYDWNISSGDAGGAKSSTDVYKNVTNNLSHNKTNIVLMHDFDNNYKTLNALKDIIHYGKNNGYKFANITMETPQITHRISN